MPTKRSLPFSFSRVPVDLRRKGVELEHVEVVGLKPAQRIVDARHHLAGWEWRPGPVFGGTGLGGDHQAVARHRFNRLADHRLGAVSSSGVDDVDAEIEGNADQRNDLGLRFAVRQPEPAEPPPPRPTALTLSPVWPSIR
jgi:hypothetical protein